MTGRVRFVEVLTTASSVANYLASPNVTAFHVDRAIALLLEEIALEDIATALPPIIRRPDPGPAVPAVRELAQRWLSRLEGDPVRELLEADVADLRAEVRALVVAERGQ